MAGDVGTTSKGLGKSCILVMVVAGVERFAFKGVASNLVTYLTDVVKLSNSSAAKIVNSWSGVTFLLPLLGAFLADTFLDRYSTILVSSVLYVVGLVALTMTAFMSQWTSTSKSSTSSLIWSLFLISLGQGGYNPCLQAFGADQLDTDQDELPSCSNKEVHQCTSTQKSSFFQWWYFGICSGSLLGISLMSYLQDAFGWGIGFAIPTIAMVISVLPFSCGNRCYKHKEHKGENKTKRIATLIQAIKASVSNLMNNKITLSKGPDAVELELQEKPLSNRDLQSSESVDEQMNGGEVDLFNDVKDVLRLLPIWTMLLLFAIIFQQPATFFTKQGMTMKRNLGKHFLIPTATLQSAINVSIILLMPLYGKMVVPISRIITRDDKGITVMQRMGVGIFFSIISMVIAALVEAKRLEMSRISGTVQISIFWLLPQYIFLGFADVFMVVGMQEFFYTEVPSRLKTIGMALHLSVFGVGSFLSALLISVIEFVTSDTEGKHSWFTDDMTEARLNKYYWLLASSSTLSLMLFVHLCKKFVSRNNRHEMVNSK